LNNTKVEINFLTEVDFCLDRADLRDKLKIKEGSSNEERLLKLAEKAEEIARPKALYGEVYIEDRGEDWVKVDGLEKVVMESRVLKVNLEGAHKILPYLATCGREVEEWSESIDGMAEGFWVDEMKRRALNAATARLSRELTDGHLPGKSAAMSPGSLEDWPISEQEKLFALLGDGPDRIGVELTDSFLMLPSKSVSGIRFPTEIDFESCQLCPREGCPGRRAPYDEDLYEKRYGL